MLVIRCTYNQEVSKVKKSITTGTCPDKIYKPKLGWFEEADRFLSKNLCDAPNTFLTMDMETGETDTDETFTVRFYPSYSQPSQIPW